MSQHSMLYHKLIVCGAALLINLFFFAFHQNKIFFDGLLLPHAEIAYNVYQHNSIKTNPQRMQYIAQQQAEEQRLLDYEEVDQVPFSEPTAYRSINDTISYGILLGLVWKLAGACWYWSMQLLQIFMFVLCMWLFYDIAIILFENAQIALFCSMAQVCFIPLIYLNVQVLRDIWAYYALIFLLYGCLAYLKNKTTMSSVIMCGVLFALLQGIRPTVFFTLITVSLAVWLWFKHASMKKVTTVLGMFWVLNVVLFWLPFMAYNKVAYDHYLVSPVGQDLYEGLGEFPNDKGYIMDDEVFRKEMEEKYGLVLGTIACDAKGKELFWQAVKSDPVFYGQCLLKRVRFLFFFNPLWTSYVDDLFKDARTGKEKIICAIKHPASCIMKVIDYCGVKFYYVEFYLLLGWLGFFMLMLRKHYLPVLMVMALIISSLSKFPSHMESRYLVTFYWAFSFFVGYLVWSGKEYLFNHKQTKVRKS